jgi:serine phosphatase RsbU (regulator of sigma subunit)
MSPVKNIIPDPASLVKAEIYDDYLASLRYAGIIQKALMPDSDLLKNHFCDYFVLFMPRDIVSGDFYYVFKSRSHLCIAAGDCTGHGVPGALLSILGISFLNEILQGRSDLKANRVLNMMREKVMKALRQTGDKSEAKDSIDIGLVIYEHGSDSLQFSGANRPLIRVRKGDLVEYKADKMTIGVAPLKESPFSNQIVDVVKGDSFYLFSDGFSDQFGEETDKKFKHKEFKNFISTLSGFPMNQQRNKLECLFTGWKGKSQQIDDVLVFGFQL